MPIELSDLLRSREPLERAWGDSMQAVMQASRAAADAAVDGTISFYDKQTHIGRTNIEWSAPHHNHQEWRAQLNRFYWINSLAAVYRETGDEKYAEAARDYIGDWIRAHPAQPDWEKPAYDSVLNLCIRLGNSQWPGWVGTLPIFMQSPAFDVGFVQDVVDSTRAQLEYLMANIAGSINWRIANADALVICGIRLSFLPGTERWRRFGARMINDAWHRQVLPDGVHYERNPSYHGWMTRVMTSYWELNRELPELGMVMDAARIRRMYDYALAVTRPNGSLNAMHDCQGARSGNHPEPMRQKRDAFLRLAGLPTELPPTSQFSPDAGQVFLRDGWDESATYITFDATQWGGGHCHLSRNSIQLHASGRTLLADPGYFTYESSDPFSAYGKSTRAHNTLNLNGWNQGESNPNHTRAFHVPGYDFVAAEYDGAFWEKPYTWNFARGRGEALQANHNRMLLWLHGRALIVIDSLVREPRNVPEAEEEAPSLEANWQLCEGGTIAIEDEGRVVAHYGDSNLLMLFPLRWPELKLSLHEGEQDPIRGWLPATETRYVPAPQISLGTAKMTGQFTEMVTVLIPFTGEEAPRVTAESHKTDGQKPARLVLRWEDGSSDELWWTYRNLIMLGRIGDIETDGGMLHLRKDAGGKVIGGCAIEGTYVEPYDTAPRGRQELIAF